MNIMDEMSNNLLSFLIRNKRYDSIVEYAKIEHPGMSDIIFTEYAGSDIRAYKENGNIKIYCPKEMSIVQEGALQRAIANGELFEDDVDNATNTARCIDMCAIPHNGLANTGHDDPTALTKMTAVVVGKVDDDGRCGIHDTDVQNGENFMKDMVNKDATNSSVENVVDNYLGTDISECGDGCEPISKEMSSDVTKIEQEVDDINSVTPEDSIDFTNYDELDPNSGSWQDSPAEQEAEADLSENEETLTDSMNEDNNIMQDDATQECGTEVTEECGDTSSEINVTEESNVDWDKLKMEFGLDFDQENDPTQECGDDANITEECDDTDITEECGDADITEECGDMDAADVKVTEECGENLYNTFNEGFITKKPKKLKPIPRDVVAYIQVELNNIQDANDQAMLSGYTCSKMELVDFYLNCIDTNDERYIVPHTKQYLETMQRDLSILLAQILRIKPINKTDRMWRPNVTYPENWRY